MFGLEVLSVALPALLLLLLLQMPSESRASLLCRQWLACLSGSTSGAASSALFAVQWQVQCCSAHGPLMPCIPPCRSRWLPEATWEAERAFWDRVCQEAKIILTPGHDCHAPKPGCFRLCFAWMPPEALAVAMGRLQRVLAGTEGTSGDRR